MLLLLLLIGCVSLSAENKTPAYQITGQAVEQNSGKSIPYATVTLQTDSAKLMKKISCDVSGKFSIPVNVKRKYTLVLSALGYTEAKVAVEITDAKTDVGKVNMTEGAMMKTVTVEAQKPLVKVDVDKITYSIEADPDSKTSNGLEMLRKVPLLAVDGDENITLNGQSNYKVLVNGKSSSMMSKNFKEVIKSLPANSIKDIEVITNPSSKYEAEGVGGIINIITIKKTMNGYNGSVSAGFDSFGSMNGSVYLTTKVNKFGFSARYSANQYKRPNNEYTSYRENYVSSAANQYYTNQSGKSNSSGLSQNFSGEASYDIDSLNLITMSFWGYQGDNRNNSSSETEIKNQQKVMTSNYRMNSNGKSTYGSVSGNIDYQKTFKKPDKTFTVSYKLDNNPNTYNYYTGTENILNYRPYQQRSVNDALSREQTLQIDYYDPLTKMHQVECGVKAILRQNDSNSDTYQYLNDQWVDDAARSNELDYNQYILGAYVGYVYKLKKFSLKTGLRTELTWNDAVSKSLSDTSFTNRLQNVVPYITLSYQLKPGKTIKASYTQRLYRPGIWYLNPYRNDMDRLDIRYGNPDLKSEIANSFELGYSTYTPKINFSLTATGSFTNNSIESITSMVDTVRMTTYKNIGKDMNIGLSTYFSYRPNQKFNVYFNGGASYVKLQANNGYTITSEGISYRGSLGTRLALWKDGSVNGNFGVYSPSVRLQSKSSTYAYSNLGVSQYLLKKKLMLTLSVSEPFTKYKKYTSNYTDVNYKMNSEYISQVRSLRLNLTYNFGKMDVSVKKARRGISNDDVKSSGGSGN